MVGQCLEWISTMFLRGEFVQNQLPHPTQSVLHSVSLEVSNNLYSKSFLLYKEKQTIITSTLQSPILAVMTKKETIFIFLGVINKYEKYHCAPKFLYIPYNMTTQCRACLIMHIWIRDFQFNYIGKWHMHWQVLHYIIHKTMA